MSNIDRQALRTDQLIANALETAKQLRELQESPVADAIFESIIENENGKEIQFERPISDLAFAAFWQMEKLVDALEAVKQDSARWFKAFEKAVSVGARYEEQIEELTGKLEAAEKRIAELEALAKSVKFDPIPMEVLGNKSDGKKHPYMFGAGYNSAVVHCESMLLQALAAAGIGKGE